jgi:hypothetical protein
MLRVLSQSIASVGAALAAALLSLTVANAETAPDNTSWNYWATEVFGKTLRDQTAMSSQTEWPDASALGYARSSHSDAAAVQWLPQQPLPAVDGINAKIAGYGGGENGSNGFYGTVGSLSIPVAQQWGLQLDGDLGSDNGIGYHTGAAHLFWRDPSIGLLGAYVSYSHDNGFNDPLFGNISENTARFAAEGEYYWNRWTLRGLAGVETGSIHSDVLPLSVPNRFFDDVSVAYYVTDNFELSAGHAYTFGTHFLTLGGEYGFALGGGRMASLFADGWIGEGGNNGALAGLRIYFGQHDKSLMDRHRQDDPREWREERCDVRRTETHLFQSTCSVTNGQESRTVTGTGRTREDALSRARSETARL